MTRFKAKRTRHVCTSINVNAGMRGRAWRHLSRDRRHISKAPPRRGEKPSRKVLNRWRHKRRDGGRRRTGWTVARLKNVRLLESIVYVNVASERGKHRGGFRERDRLANRRVDPRHGTRTSPRPRARVVRGRRRSERVSDESRSRLPWRFDIASHRIVA